MHTLGRGRGGGASDTEFVFAKLISIPGIDFQLADSYDDPIIYTSSSGYKRWQINFSESIPRFQNLFTNTGSVCMGPRGGGEGVGGEGSPH